MTKNIFDLNDGEKRMLDMIRAYTAEHGYPPTNRELGEMLGVTASTACRMLKMLALKGKIVKVPGGSRAIRVIEGAA